MDLSLKITQKEGTNMSSLVKQMCALKCRVKVDTEEGQLSIIGMDDNNIDKVIDAVDETFKIDAIDIVPTVEVPEPVITEESLEIAKIEFSDKEVEERINKLMRIIYWAMYSNKAPSRDICQFIMSVGAEISMKYSPRELLKFSIGDVVDCNYGSHPSGEISGGHVHAIVCDIDPDGTVYVVPITKEKIVGNLERYLPFNAKTDVEYTEPKYTGGTVLIKKGEYICPERFYEVVGTARPEFFNKLLERLPQVSKSSNDNYEEKYAERVGDVEEDDNISQNMDENPVEKIIDQDAEKTSTSDSSIIEDGKEGASKKTKKFTAEEYLAAIFPISLGILDKSKSAEEQIDDFLNGIGFNTNERIVKQAFVVACEVKKVNYENVILELHNVFPKVREEIIKRILIEEFNKWLANNPAIKERYPRISFMVLLKVFSARMQMD